MDDDQTAGEDYIIGGQLTKANQYPFMVRLSVACGGKEYKSLALALQPSSLVAPAF